MMLAGAFFSAAQCSGNRPHCEKTRAKAGSQRARGTAVGQSVQQQLKTDACVGCTLRSHLLVARGVLCGGRRGSGDTHRRRVCQGFAAVGGGRAPWVARRSRALVLHKKDGRSEKSAAHGAPLMSEAAPAHCRALITAWSSAPCEPMSSCLFIASTLDARLHMVLGFVGVFSGGWFPRV